MFSPRSPGPWIAALALLMSTGAAAQPQPAPDPVPEAPPGGLPADRPSPDDPSGDPLGGLPPGPAPDAPPGGLPFDPQPGPAQPGEPAEAEDVWIIEDESDAGDYQPPMVVADYDQGQPPGYDYEPHHNHRWFFHNLTAVRVNPLGLTNRFRTGYRMQLSHSPEPIFLDSFAAVALDTEITPAFGYVGGRLEIQPAAIFNFWGSYGLFGSFGTFSYARSFDSAQVDYNDDFLEDTRDLDYATLGQRAIVSGLFQFGIGGVAFRDNAMATYMNLDLHDGDQVFYDPTLDVLIPNAGWVLTNDADLLVLTDFGLKVGLRHTVTHALYRSEHLAGGEKINTPHHRVGPAILYTFFEDPVGAMWNKPTLVLLAQWWVEHRFRTTDNPALPYLVLAFVQEGDLLVSDKE